MYIKNIVEYVKKEQLDKAISLCKEALTDNPDFCTYYEYLSDLYFKKKNFSKCQIIIENGLEVNKKSVFLNDLKLKLENKILQPEEFCGKYLFLPIKDDAHLFEGGARIKRNQKLSINENEPLVTIVTVVYNNVDSFERCIRSVINQTYKNIEYIVIDGGSDKPTLDLIKKYEDNIEYFISERDKGIYNAMNKGIQVAQGDYVCLLNSDDFYDVNFIKKSVEIAQKHNSDVTYSDYEAGKSSLKAEHINEGILLGHLNICHNTFLVSKSTYNLIGPYNEELRIISDAVWIRKAYKVGIKFSHVAESLFTLSDGGLSSGGSEKDRLLFIGEVVKSYIIQFPFLSEDEAEEIYLLRFNNKRLTNVIKISEKYTEKLEFVNSLSLYVEYCFKSRANFVLSHTESDKLFLEYVKSVDKLGVDIASIKINTKHGCLSTFLSGLNTVISQRKKSAKKTILHFVSVFSAPSETFIYDLLNRLQFQTEYDNFVLYEHEKLPLERPFSNKLYVPWNDFRPEIRDQIYKFIFEKLTPDLVIAHFAINEWKLYKRIEPLGFKLPTLTMTHGIDVFNLKSDKEYKNYIINNFCKRNNTKFTTVSDYLHGELTSQGVSTSNIKKIHNTANPRFLEHRKHDDYFDYTRTLKLLSVGRCIDWKGHIDLLYGLRSFINSSYENTTLTIVYGNGTDNLKQVEAVVAKLKLTDQVELIPFVNFSVEKGYFSKFDIYVQASKYTNDDLRKSETFGVASLEAILSGLPIIVTTAGGLPEVVGKDGQFSRIVRHTSASSIAKALEEFFKHPNTFTNNIEYAKERLAHFSEEKQIAALSTEINKLTAKKIKVAMFSTSTIQGAGYAAFRLFRGLRDHSDIEPTLFTTVRNHENEAGVNVVKHPSGNGKGWQALQDPKNSKPGLTIFTMNHPAISESQLWEMVKDSDVINIHWSARYLSIENIAYLSNLGKPLIMTIRDMLPITGGCHFFHGCDKWKKSCSNCQQLIDNHDDFPQKVLQAKRNSYNFKNITLVALSKHTKSILKQAPMFKDCRIEVIANSIETDVFKPHNKVEARKTLGLPLDRRIIGYVPSFSSEVKGYREVTQAFEMLNNTDDSEKPMVMLVGNKTPADDTICLDKISLGYIADNEKLALAYAAADVTVVPSLEETFSNTTAESISCGTPVVGFKTGAIPDLAKDGVTGYSYDVGDVEGLAFGLNEILKSKEMIKECRDFAEKTLEFSLQAQKYEKLIKNVVQNNIMPAIDTEVGNPMLDLFESFYQVVNKALIEKN
jgi:glycosyltransferase involved in cell wall biosynthesis